MVMMSAFLCGIFICAFLKILLVVENPLLGVSILFSGL